MDNYSVETIEAMKDLGAERLKAQKNIAACQKRLDQCPGVPQIPKLAGDIDPYVIEVNFEAIPDPEQKKYFLGLPTSFYLEKDQVQALIDIGPQLLEQSPEFQKFIQGLGQPWNKKGTGYFVWGGGGACGFGLACGAESGAHDVSS